MGTKIDIKAAAEDLMDALIKLKARYDLLIDQVHRLRNDYDDLFDAINDADPGWLRGFLDRKDSDPCDTCIGKPSDVCPDCKKCEHRCECPTPKRRDKN